MPTAALAADASSLTICGITWDTSTYAKTVDGQVVTEEATVDDYNLYWDAEAATLTLQDAQLDVQDLAAIAAEVDLLTIHLIGENTISVTNSQANIDLSLIHI